MSLSVSLRDVGLELGVSVGFDEQVSYVPY